ncbi:MAG: tyrosine-protein kinase family protein [Candidatus Electrothrix sp. AR4]|nr:tyrosine-protein kinase family protein [Candidatus Electrothrix sp. AR4]
MNKKETFSPPQPTGPKARRKKKIARNAPSLWIQELDQHPEILETFRTLANKIAFINDTEKLKVFLMTGSDDKVGTSTILFNTGLMMGRSMPDRRILMVDTNIDRPSLNIAFDHYSSSGLIDYLLARALLVDIVQRTFLSNLDIITSNRMEDPHLSPFSMPSFTQFIEEVRTKYDIILLDSAPVLQSSHTKMLLPKTDGVIIVTEANKTRFKVLEELVRQLNMEGATLLGSFLNKRRYVIPKWVYQAM